MSLQAATIVLSGIPIQRCWAHKIRKILDKIRNADQPAPKRAIHKVMNAPQSTRGPRRCSPLRAVL
jgi:transposase-like protein